jgi:hypothetical protein
MGRFGNKDLRHLRQHPHRIYAANQHVGCAARRRGERHGPRSAAHAEPDNLRTLTAVIDTSALCAESAIRPQGAQAQRHFP